MTTLNENYDIVDVFCEIIGVTRPEKWNGEKWGQLRNMWDLVNQDLHDFKRALTTAQKAMYDKGLTIATPSSIEGEFSRVVATWRKNVSATDPTPADFAAYRNRLITLGYNILF